jgi:hypothetical protein
LPRNFFKISRNDDKKANDGTTTGNGERQRGKRIYFFHRLPHPNGFAVTNGGKKDLFFYRLPRNFFKISRNDDKKANDKNDNDKGNDERQRGKRIYFFHRLPHPIGFAVTALTTTTNGNGTGLPRNFFKISRNDDKKANDKGDGKRQRQRRE